MKATSFGHLEILIEDNGNSVAEYLIFENEGRFHMHNIYECLTVIKGVGEVFVADQTFKVGPGDRVIIPPNTKHKMVPSKGDKLEGLLWYHKDKGQTFE